MPAVQPQRPTREEAAIKALTLHQPYASFIAWGEKRVETRSWPPHAGVVGSEILIHAAKRPMDAVGEELLERIDRLFPPVLSPPYGAIVARARVLWSEEVAGYGGVTDRMEAHAAARDRDLGDWSPGRWLWALDVETLPAPIPCRGSQGLWRVPDDVVRQVRAIEREARG